MIRHVRYGVARRMLASRNFKATELLPFHLINRICVEDLTIELLEAIC